MGQNILQANGGQAQKQTHFVSLFTSRFLTGLYTNRNLLRGPMQYIYSDFYHLGSTDALCDGLNSELSIRQTMIRRPGNPVWCSTPTDSAVDSFYSFHEANGMISVIVDTTAKVDVATPSSLTTIFTKSASASESQFQGVNNSLYITDGVDTVKYIPNEPGNLNPDLPSTPYIWNFSAGAPTAAITYQITETGSSGVMWAGNTIWSTMGLLLDSNGNVQQLFSVNSLGTNSTQIGTTGNGAPDFDLTPGGTVTESGGTPITWTNWGEIVTWTPGMQTRNFSYAPTGATLNIPSVIYDPVTNQCYAQINGGSGVIVTASTTKPNFTPTNGWTQTVGAAKWAFYDPHIPGVWQPSTSYPAFGGGSDGLKSVVTPCTLPQAALGTSNATPVYLQVSSGGTSAPAGSYSPQWATSAGYITTETGGSDIIWNCLGSGTWTALTSYIPWEYGSNDFGVIYDTVSSTFQVCISATGPTGSSTPTFASTYGATTQDGINVGTPTFVGVTWSCVGSKLSWAANTQWYLPVQGFVPPQPSQPYGGATLSESGVNQYVINSGKSGGSAPSWNGIPNTTTDGTVTWRAVSNFTAVGFSWTKGMGYTYALKARKTSDPYVLTSPPLQIPGTNSPNITGPLGPPTGAGDGTVTTAAPVTIISGSNAGAQVLLTIAIPPGGFDPQFDTIEFYRSADGFATSGPYLFLTDIAIPPVGTLFAQIIDFMPDSATNLLPGLNPLITAPISNANDPIPGSYGSTQFVASSLGSTTPKAGTALQGVVYHQGRLWGFIGNSVFASGGPDTTTGNGMTAWPPTYEFPFDSPIVLLVATATALLVFTTTDIQILAGGPAIADYYSQLVGPGFGIDSQNAVALIAGLPYVFTSDRQFITIDPGGGFTRIGHPIGDKLVSYDPSSVYVTWHSYGDLDHAVYISNGSTEWYRCDPNPTPDSQLTGPVWSPRATIAGGFKAMQSIVVSAGNRKMLIGPSSAGYILARDSTFTTFTDASSAYSSYFTMGNIVLAHPGQMAETAFIEADFSKVGSQPSVFVLFDELGAYNGAAFENISNEYVSDPPKLYGPGNTPDTIWMNRYYFGQTTPDNGGDETPTPAWCKFLQLKVDFGNTDTVQNEMLAFTIFGALYQEK